jgi:hypothetical protein
MVVQMRHAFFYSVFLCLIPLIAFAANQPGAPGMGGVAQYMMEPVGLLNDFVNAACFLFGGSFLFAAVIKYFEHRRSPLMVPISTVVYLVIAGMLLIILPFAYMATESGVHFSLFH